MLTAALLRRAQRDTSARRWARLCVVLGGGGSPIAARCRRRCHSEWAPLVGWPRKGPSDERLALPSRVQARAWSAWRANSERYYLLAGDEDATRSARLQLRCKNPTRWLEDLSRHHPFAEILHHHHHHHHDNAAKTFIQ